MKPTIRLKTIITILPLLVASLTVLGTTSIFASRAGMMRLAMRNLAFKAEILKQYGDEQWGLLLSQGFSSDPDFRLAAQRALASRAQSLLREDSEWFFALDLDGQLAMSASLDKARRPLPPDLLRQMRQGVTGSISFGQGRERSYGQAFYFEPFGWYVVASDRASAIFAETERLTSIILWTFALSVLAAAVLLVRLATSIARPITEVSGAMTELMRSSDFSRSLAVRSDDEVGALARNFNALCRELDRSYEKMGDIAIREAQARSTVASREIEALVALGRVAEYRDQNTGFHIIRVGLYAKLLAGLFYADEAERRVIYYAAPLHDLGKIGIPDSILLKEGALDPGEFETMKTHTTIGYSILKESKNPNLLMGASIALTHHERYDGKGYPRGIKAGEIPLCGRIVAVIDVFDALTSRRPYKDAWPADRAFEQLSAERGGHFDPEIVDSFLAHRPEVMEILARNQ